MAKVKPEVQAHVFDMIEEMPGEHVLTCGLCNRTLFDNLMSIAVSTGAPEKTVAKAFADRYNEDKRADDQITANAFYERIKYMKKVNEKELNGETHHITENDHSAAEEAKEESFDLESDTTGLPSTNKDGSDGNRDTSGQLFIPPGISQTDLAAGIAEFFESVGRNSAILLKTCLMAMNGMTVRMGASEIKDAIDAWYRPQDDGDTEQTES